MGHVIGYARVSTLDQNPQAQHDALDAAGATRVFVDHASGARADRPELAACLDYLRPNETLVVWRLDRLGRSLAHLIDVVDQLSDRDIEVQSLTEGFDTTTSGGRLVFHVFAAVAEFERQLIRERTMAGLEVARREGRTGGPTLRHDTPTSRSRTTHARRRPQPARHRVRPGRQPKHDRPPPPGSHPRVDTCSTMSKSSYSSVEYERVPVEPA